MRHLATALLLAPLAACFEPVEPEIEPAALKSGLWEIHLSDMQVSGDCATIAVVDPGPMDVYAWIEVDDDEVFIDIEGALLEGRIDGSWLGAHGELGYGYSDIDHGGPDEPVETLPVEDDGETDDGDDDAGDGGAVILPACVEPEPQPEESVRISLDATILAEDLIRGELTVRMSSEWGGCELESALVGIASADDGPIEVEPMPAEPYETEPGDPGEEVVVGD